MACEHSIASRSDALQTYELGVRLSLAVALGRSEYAPTCRVCGSNLNAVACLECDVVACPEHGSMHNADHKLGVCLWPSAQGQLWCWSCKDVIVDPKFEAVRLKTIHKIVSQSKPNGTNGNGTSNGVNGNGVNGSAANGVNGNGAAQLNGHGTTNGTTNGTTTPTTKEDKELRKIPFHAHLGLRGFVNMGATCYISVVLQALVHNPLVRAFFLAGGHCSEMCNVPNCLACCVDRIYCSFYGSKSVSGYGVPDLLVAVATKNPNMGAGATEQDAHEFMHFLLEELHTSHLTPSPTPMSIDAELDMNVTSDPLTCDCVAHRNFGGALKSRLSCECGFIRHTQDPLIDVSLEVSDRVGTLQQCLERFTAPEPLLNYTCEKCHEQNKVTKQILIERFPPVLLVQLKRFKHIGTSHKVETPIKFPLEIDLAPYTTATEKHPLVYELYGVVCHHGSLDTGHYTCLMKHASGVWFNFDDTMVTPVPVSRVLGVNAYLLFYIVKWAI